MDQKWPAHAFDGFVGCPALRREALHEVREVFRNRESTRFQRMATYVSRLAEALARAGRFAQRDRVLDVAIALEGMYELPKRYKSRTLQERVSSYLGADAEDRERIKERIRTFYKARSGIVHSGRGEGLRSQTPRRSSRVSTSPGGRCSSSCVKAPLRLGIPRGHTQVNRGRA